MISRESGENSAALIQFLCALIVDVCLLLCTVNIFKYLSSEPVSRYWPSKENEHARTAPEWDFKVVEIPLESFCHNFTVLSAEPVAINVPVGLNAME